MLWGGLSAMQADPGDADSWRLSADHPPQTSIHQRLTCYYIWFLPFTLYLLTHSHAHNIYLLNFRWIIGKTYLLNHLQTSWNFIPDTLLQCPKNKDVLQCSHSIITPKKSNTDKMMLPNISLVLAFPKSTQIVLCNCFCFFLDMIKGQGNYIFKYFYLSFSLFSSSGIIFTPFKFRFLLFSFLLFHFPVCYPFQGLNVLCLDFTV